MEQSFITERQFRLKNKTKKFWWRQGDEDYWYTPPFSNPMDIKTERLVHTFMHKNTNNTHYLVALAVIFPHILSEIFTCCCNRESIEFIWNFKENI